MIRGALVHLYFNSLAGTAERTHIGRLGPCLQRVIADALRLPPERENLPLVEVMTHDYEEFSAHGYALIIVVEVSAQPSDRVDDGELARVIQQCVRDKFRLHDYSIRVRQVSEVQVSA